MTSFSTKPQRDLLQSSKEETTDKDDNKFRKKKSHPVFQMQLEKCSPSPNPVKDKYNYINWERHHYLK